MRRLRCRSDGLGRRPPRSRWQQGRCSGGRSGRRRRGDARLRRRGDARLIHCGGLRRRRDARLIHCGGLRRRRDARLTANTRTGLRGGGGGGPSNVSERDGRTGSESGLGDGRRGVSIYASRSIATLTRQDVRHTVPVRGLRGLRRWNSGLDLRRCAHNRLILRHRTHNRPVRRGRSRRSIRWRAHTGLGLRRCVRCPTGDVQTQPRLRLLQLRSTPHAPPPRPTQPRPSSASTLHVTRTLHPYGSSPAP